MHPDPPAQGWVGEDPASKQIEKDRRVAEPGGGQAIIGPGGGVGPVGRTTTTPALVNPPSAGEGTQRHTAKSTTLAAWPGARAESVTYGVIPLAGPGDQNPSLGEIER